MPADPIIEAITKEGAVAALDFALREAADYWITPAIGQMVKAALAFLTAETRLLELGRQMDAVQAECDAIPDDAPEAVGDANYDARWKVREQIDAIAANTLAGLKVKARAAQYALASDVSAECEGPGSFISLSQSLAADLLNLDTI